jgi:hypothetical protein
MSAARSIPRDPALPGLAELLPDDRLPPFVASALAEGGISDGGPTQVRYVRYRPGRSCIVLWSVGDRLVSGKLFADGRRTTLADRESYRRLAETVADASGRPVSCFLPDRRLLLHLYPLDVSLPGLSFAASARAVGEAVGRPLAEASPLAYKPWRRCVLRYRGHGEDLIGKAFRDDRGASMPARLEQLARHLRGADFVVPRALVYLPGPRLLLFESLEGGAEVGSLLRAARTDLAARSLLRETVARAAYGLADLRRAEVGPLPTESPYRVLDRLRRGYDEVAAVAPRAARALAGALDRLEHEGRGLPREPLVLSHGAFRHDQFLLHQGHLVLVDHDGLCIAGAGADAGNFLGYLDVLALRRPRLAPVVRDCERTFLAALEEQRVDVGWLDWHRTAARVKYALRAVFALAPGWPQRVETLVGGEVRASSAGGVG